MLWVAVLLASPVRAQEPPPPDEPPVETVEAPEEVLAAEPGEEPPAPSGSVAGEGLVVARVVVRSDAPVERPGEVRELITIRPGALLTERAVRQTLRNLQAGGEAYEVALFTRPLSYSSTLSSPPGGGEGAPALPSEAEAMREGGEGVEVVVVLWAATQVSGVRVAGELGRLARGDLEREIPVTARQPLIESRLLRGVYRLQELYEAQGYFDATVHLKVDVDEERKRAAVTYQVDAGARYHIADVRFEGELGPFTPQQLVARLRAEPGDPFRDGTVRDDAERLQGWLVSQGFRTAEVGQPHREVLAERHEVLLVYPVHAGPRVEVEIVGASRRELARNDLLPFLSDEGYDDALVLQAVDRVRRYFQEKGHWKVDVTWHEERAEDTLRLHFAVEPGPVYTLQQIRFTGNQEISSSRLAELMETTERRLLTLGSGRLVDAVLDDDLDNVRSYYALQGYRGYEVGPPRIDEDGRNLALTIPITEGERRRVVELRLEGVEALGESTLSGQLPLAAGGPFHPLLLEDTLQTVRGAYEAEGYLSAQVSAEQEWNDDRTLVDVTIRVIEGPRTVLDRLIIRGNVKTANEVIEDAADLDTGEPVSRVRLLEVERNLYELGIFRRVSVELGPADLSEPTRDVIVRLQEGRTRRVSYGLGYDSDRGPAALLGFSHRNLFGRAFTFQSDLRYGEKQRLVRVVLDQPAFTRWDIPMLYSVALQDEELASYEVQRLVSQVEAVYQADEWRYGLAFDYRIVNSTLTIDPGAIDPGSGPIIERRDQDIRISSVIPNLFVDRRDNPVDPTRGWSANARLQWAFPIGGVTEADFLKTFLQHTQYFKLGFGHVAASLRVGAIEPLIDLTEDVPGSAQREPPNLKVPIDERFFAGGDFSHRAYDRDELGIPGATLFPDGSGRGGNGLFLLNLDYRFPVWGPVGAAVFVDGGNVWPDWRDMDPSEIQWGVGVEARYVSPIGPVRAGVGYQLDPADPFTSDRYHVFLAVGNPF
jgi:outer membrane protein assembly complex protein YaeT